jgi:hypothetical protein
MAKRPGLKLAFDNDIADAKQALEKAGLTHDQLLHMAAQDWVRNIRLKSLLDEAEARKKVQDSDDLAQWLSNEIKELVVKFGPDFIDTGKRLQRRETAITGGKARHKDQAPAKEAIRAEWKAWQRGDRRYYSKGRFADKMGEKYPDIKSSQTVEKWCREWEKEPKENS